MDFYEDLLPDSRVDERFGNFWELPGKYPGEKWFHSPVPTLSTLSDIARVYNAKTLTYPEDALAAFADIQAMLHRMYPGGSTYGMPENFFDIALTWAPYRSTTRRHASTKSRAHRLPSWSWLGWKGSISLPIDLEFEVGGESGTLTLKDTQCQWQSGTQCHRRRAPSEGGFSLHGMATRFLPSTKRPNFLLAGDASSTMLEVSFT